MRWQIIKSTYSFLCPWLKVRKDYVKLPSGIELEDFYVVEVHDWVNVIAITEDNHFIIEKQYRHGIGEICYELPAGCIGDGELPLEAAKRELLEETGYAGGEWTYFYTSAPNASGMNNLCHTFLAKDVRKISEPQQETTEDIKIFFYTRKNVEKLLINKSIIEASMQAPLWKYLATDFMESEK